MKKIYSLIAVALMVVFATVSCNKDNEGEKYRETSSTNFSLTGSTSCSYGLSVDEGEADVNVDDVVITRAIATDAVTLQLQVSKDPQSLASVTVDNLVFNEGETQKSPVVHLRGLGEGQSCTTTFTIPETDAVIAGKSYSFTVTFKRDVRASWINVETKSMFQNGLFGMFNLDPTGDYASVLVYHVNVEKRSDANIFRVKNITKSSVCPFFEGYDLDGDMYFNIDATNAKFVEVENTGLKMYLNPSYGEQWAGTHCGTYDPKYEVGGTFDAGSGIIHWNPDQLQCWMPAYGAMEDGYFFDCYETVLWLDENNMGDDFNRDYDFVEYLPSTYQICEAFNFTFNGAPIYIGDPNDPTKKAALEEKYGTVYAIPDYAMDGYDIYFNINKKGKLALPASYKVQDFGMEIMAGVEVYMAMKNADISEAGGANINYDVVSKDGAVLGSNYTDHFYLFDDEATIDDYVGTYTCGVSEADYIEISKVSDKELAVAGICSYGPFSFIMDTEDGEHYFPSFNPGMINSQLKLYAFAAYQDMPLQSYDYLMTFKRLADGTLLPCLTYTDVTEIRVYQLKDRSLSWVLGPYYFEDYTLVPEEADNVAKQMAKITPDKSHKLGDYKGEPKTVLTYNGKKNAGLTFNGQPVKAKSKANRKAQLEWIKK